MFSKEVCLEFNAINKQIKKSVQTGDSLLEFVVVLIFDIKEFFTGVLLELAAAASASSSSSWSIIVIRFFNSFPKSPIEAKIYSIKHA